jgi:hypothetical protein|tara:strand:- start:83 stop:499 length:417 start_codon:yes stop_codon:yes gene_type:complete
MITFLTSSSSFRRGKKNLWSFSSSVVLDDDGDEILPLFFRGAALSPRGTEEEEEEEREDRKPTKSLPFLKPLLGVFLLIVDFSEERVREGRRVDPAKGADMSRFFLRKGGGQMKNSFEEKKIFTTNCSIYTQTFRGMF